MKMHYDVASTSQSLWSPWQISAVINLGYTWLMCPCLHQYLWEIISVWRIVKQATVVFVYASIKISKLFCLSIRKKWKTWHLASIAMLAVFQHFIWTMSCDMWAAPARTLFSTIHFLQLCRCAYVTNWK